MSEHWDEHIGWVDDKTGAPSKPKQSTTKQEYSDRLELIRRMIELTGDDPTREGLQETPRRFLNAWAFWTKGYDEEPEKVLKCFKDGSENYDELVFVGNIATFSLCEHHLVPFFGVTHIGYIPNGKVVGLSKLPRLVEIFARRLQVQERITTQIAEALMEHLKPKAVGVVMRARHLCMESRGVQKPGTITYTNAIRGLFKDSPQAREEFMKFVEMADRDTKL